MKNTPVLCLLCLSLSSTVARAEEPDAGGVTQYRFEDDLLHGEAQRPQGEVLQVRRLSKRGSLIRVREHFVDQLVKAVENL